MCGPSTGPSSIRARHVVAAVDLRLNVFLFIVIPKGFFPQQDTGQLQGGIRGDATSSFQLMKRKLQEAAAIVQSDPGGGHRDRFGGRRGRTVRRRRRERQPHDCAQAAEARHVSADQVINRLRPQLNKVTGVRTFLQAIQDIAQRRRPLGQRGVPVHAARR